MEVPRITTEDLAKMLSGDKSGPPSPSGPVSPKSQIPTSPTKSNDNNKHGSQEAKVPVAVAGFKEQLKEKDKVVVPLISSPKK